MIKTSSDNLDSLNLLRENSLVFFSVRDRTAQNQIMFNLIASNILNGSHVILFSTLNSYTDSYSNLLSRVDPKVERGEMSLLVPDFRNKLDIDGVISSGREPDLIIFDSLENIKSSFNTVPDDTISFTRMVRDSYNTPVICFSTEEYVRDSIDLSVKITAGDQLEAEVLKSVSGKINKFYWGN